MTIDVWPHSLSIVVFGMLLLPPELLDQAANRVTWLRWLGHDADRSPCGDSAVVWSVMLREGAVMIIAVAVLLQISRDNPAVPEILRAPGLGPLEPIITYPRLFQRWSMFEEAPITDGTLVVDARTADGRHLDPLTNRAPDFEAAWHGPWRLSPLYCDYYLKIQRPHYRAHLAGLERYLQGWHRSDGRPDTDRLVSFEVYWVSHVAPAPGSTTPTAIERRLLLRSTGKH